MTMMRDADPQKIGVPVSTGTIDATSHGMNKDEAVQVMLCTVNRFCVGRGAVPAYPKKAWRNLIRQTTGSKFRL